MSDQKNEGIEGERNPEVGGKTRGEPSRYQQRPLEGENSGKSWGVSSTVMR